MAKQAGAGELRTQIMVFSSPDPGASDTDGFPVDDMVNVFGEGVTRQCKWVNAHGSEVWDARQAGMTEPATLTMRYTDKIAPTCEIYRGKDPKPYEVVSVNDVEDHHVWLEVKVQRKAASP